MNGKRTLLFFMALGLVLALHRPLTAGEGRVAVLPLTIHSQINLAYLQKNMLETLVEGLTQQQIPVVPLSLTQPWQNKKIPDDWAELRAIGRQLEADYLLYGSLSRIGQRLFLRGNLLETASDKPPVVFSLFEDGLENLLRLMERFAREAGGRIQSREKIASISVKGNQRIETSAILRAIKSKAGDPYSPEFLDQDLRAVFKMGYFSDVRVETAQTPQGKAVTFVVEERPFIKRIEIRGNREVKEEDLKDQITVKPFTIYNQNTVNESVEKMTAYYQSKGYYNVRITSTMTLEDQGKAAVLVFQVTEGKKVYIKTITFQGNKGVTEKQLKEVMSTNEKGFFSFITSSGVYKKELLEQDLEKIAAYYYNHGYLKAKVGEPTVRHEGDWLYIEIPIEEGNPYRMGKVDIQGDLIRPKENLMALLSVTKEKFYNRGAIRKDILTLSDLYSQEGFAFADINPLLREDPQALKVDLTYEIRKGSKVYFERIDIVGNIKTRDKVIRRELKVTEKGLFDAAALRKSNENLQRLDFFEEVNLSTSPGSEEDRMRLKVEVKEKLTGSFSLGAGYSAVEKFMFVGQIAERNLFGRGQRLSLDAQLGAITTRYNIGFFEPWLFDTRISSDSNIFKWTREYDKYNKDSIGGSQGFGYPLWGDDLRLYLTYSYEDANVTDVAEDAAQIIQDMKGRHRTSSLRLTLRRDTRDLIFNTTKGSLNTLSVEYAGGPLGGTNYFTRYGISSGWYIPLFWGTTFFANGKWGYITRNPGGDLPLYEKFYLGGINSIRGFKYNAISPTDPNTGQQIGGEQMIQFNLEFIFPIMAKAGLKGVLFYDMGNVFTKDEGLNLGNLRKSAGLGIRWYSPIGPLRLEWGYVLDRKPGEDQSNWEFTIGAFF